MKIFIPALIVGMKLVSFASACEGLPDICTSTTDTVSAQQLEAIIDFFGSREMREIHRDWHQLRMDWRSMSSGTRDSWLANGWTSPQPQNYFFPYWPESTDDPARVEHDYLMEIGTNVAGEDFLFMHRHMVKKLRQLLIARNLPCVSGWNPIPMNILGETGQGDWWPVPSGNWSKSKIKKTFENIKKWELQYLDPEWLKAHSLGYVGQTVELTIHNKVHELWAGKDICAGLNDRAQAHCNYLKDNYTAAINPVFWKLHGWVDSLIDHWLAANGFREISSNCGKKDCYQWKGQWLGKPMDRCPFVK